MPGGEPEGLHLSGLNKYRIIQDNTGKQSQMEFRV